MAVRASKSDALKQVASAVIESAALRPCSDRDCGVELAEYHVGDPHLLCLADAEIRPGAAGNGPASLPLPLLSSKCKFDSCDSRNKPVPTPGSYAHGASATGTGATYQSGCSTSGNSRWIQTSAGESVRSWRRDNKSPTWIHLGSAQCCNALGSNVAAAALFATSVGESRRTSQRSAIRFAAQR
jgi:hypothetical protein